MKTNVEKLREQAEAILIESRDMLSDMNEFSEWNSLSEIITNFSTLSKFINKVVLAIEVSATDIADDIESLKSEDKVEAAAQIMDDMITLPFFLEAIDQKMFALLISMAVESINSRYGSDWNLEAARESIRTGSDFINEVVDA